MSLLFGDYRGSTSKGGPRVLTFVPTIAGEILANCPGCTGRWSKAAVLGADFVDASHLGDGGQPLPIGWYELQTEVDVYWQQVNPADACSINPYRTGLSLRAGGCAIFYVDAPERDGILLLNFCTVALTNASCNNVPSGLARVNRRDTILLPSDLGGSDAQIVPAPQSRACIPANVPQSTG